MAVHFKVSTMMLSISSAEKLNKFLHTLVEGTWDTKKVDALGRFVTRLLLTFTGALASIIAVVAIAPMSAVITGFAIMYYGIKGIKKLILDITDPKTGIKKKQAKSASEVLKSV
jgi:type IV secretory pathway VirB2 component (pilin)